MKEKLRVFESRVREWMEYHADGLTAQVLLSAVAILEASIIPLPPSTIMVAMIVLGEQRRWVYLALLTTVTSVVGGILGYGIGLLLYNSLGLWIIEQYHLAGYMDTIGRWFDRNTFMALFIAAFTPIPYKAFTISGGFFSVNLFVFTSASFIGRGLRYFVVGYLADVFGEHVAKRIFRYFALTTLVATTIIIVGLILASVVNV